jgi:hypothetical protein
MEVVVLSYVTEAEANAHAKLHPEAKITEVFRSVYGYKPWFLRLWIN